MEFFTDVRIFYCFSLSSVILIHIFTHTRVKFKHVRELLFKIVLKSRVDLMIHENTLFPDYFLNDTVSMFSNFAVCFRGYLGVVGDFYSNYTIYARRRLRTPKCIQLELDRSYNVFLTFQY